ncbi:hypothetical protein K9O30_15010 [Clostridium bowmanii]|uniref:hypothetical protein n=1 Tax=Clostridium bowmanii TaxID=132925 RepID=UPI001C0CD8B6|nr:hypothetical protein [Clostridium bowmanii]MBU3190747.1 hypothetical protein [Clostridium bowmanii]MCA1075007.1 hypothetical protein [Clostridium bowmanii]
MNSTDISKMFYEPLLNGMLMAFKILWATNEFKSAVIGVPVSIITYRIVGRIFSYGRTNDIWFGSIGGKILYYLINTFLVWLVMKII